MEFIAVSGCDFGPIALRRDEEMRKARETGKGKRKRRRRGRRRVREERGTKGVWKRGEGKEEQKGKKKQSVD